MTERRKGTVDRKQKFSPDAVTTEEVLKERLVQVEHELRLLRQSMQTTTIHAFDRAPYIDATQGEVLWDFQFQRGYIHHHDKWRPLAPPTYHIKLFKDDKPVVAGDGRFKFAISRDMGGFTPAVGEPYPSFYLYDAEAYLTTSGSCTVSLWNNTQGNDLLSSPLVISGLHDDGTRVIDPVDSVVNWKDQIWINIDAAGGMGLGVILVFNPVID